MFTQRLIVALIVGPVMLTATYLGGWYYFIPVLFLMLVAGWEYANMMRVLNHKLPLWLLLPAIALLLFAAWRPELNLSNVVLFLSLFAGLIYCLTLFERGITYDAALDWFALVAGIMLLGWVGGHFFLLRGLPQQGWQWTALALVSIWSADVAAYCVGKWLAGSVLGRHALSPRLSPNKTVEGYVGGIIGGTAAALIAASILDLPLLLAGLAGLLVSVFGLFGDLSISMLKREAGLKDSGKIFPGHGGALDRSDSLLWAIAIVYYLVLFLGPLFP
ncbi:MAG: phosphatidate cytidylyltransferase [Candidatus Promineofilum sp.]|nr:phosphatidate cytidylyltransferase [Promineifilum sp.]